MAEKKKLGDLLVEGKVVSSTQLQSALAHQKQWGGRLGSALVEKGFVSEDVLAKFLSFQLNFPSVNLAKVQVPPEVLSRLPVELREKYLAVPIAMIKEGKGEAMILAIADPTDLGVVDEIGFATGVKVKPVIATESSIKQFIFGDEGRLARFRKDDRPIGENDDLDFAVVRGSVDEIPSPGAGGSMPPEGSDAPGVVGEATVDFEAPGSDPVPAPVASPAPTQSSPDPFMAALRANAGAGQPPMSSQAVAHPAPIVAEAFEATIEEPEELVLGTAQSGSVLGDLDAFAQNVPAGFDAEDHTEPELLLSDETDGQDAPSFEPPVYVAPPSPAPSEVEPAPSFGNGSDPKAPTLPENPLQDTWNEPQSGGSTYPDDAPIPEISLPYPEASGNGGGGDALFAVPEDLELAEASLPPPEPADSNREPELVLDSLPEPLLEAPPEFVPEDAPGQDAQPVLEPEAGTDAPEPPASGQDGAVPDGENLDPSDMEKTALGPGASEPTWPAVGELSSAPSAAALAEATVSDGELDATSPSFEPPPQPRSAPPAGPERIVPPAPEAAAGPEPSPTPVPKEAPATSNPEQASLNAIVTKKLKLLNAIAELLLEKGLISEEELREKISRKRG